MNQFNHLISNVVAGVLIGVDVGRALGEMVRVTHMRDTDESFLAWEVTVIA